MTTPTAIDLFSGCGGLSTGLLDCGIAVKAGFDHDARSIDAFNYNHEYRGNCKGFNADLTSIDISDLLSKAEISSVDIIAGGPPCQPFSVAGHRRGLRDKRGNLVFTYVDIVREVRPSVVIFENVPNIVNAEGGKVVQQLMRDLSDLGYDLSSTVIKVSDYGVPQQRKRFVLVGCLDGRITLPPPPTHSALLEDALFGSLERHVTVEQALRDLPDVGTPAGDLIPNHEPTFHTPQMLEELKTLVPGTRHKRSRHDRLHPDRLSYTLRAGSGNFSPLRPIHYKYDRVISVRESARIQGFADSFIWPDPIPRLQQYRQVGNAVPPPLAAALGRVLLAAMNWDGDASGLLGDPDSRPTPFYLTPQERLERRMSRSGRGASVGRHVTQ